MTAEFRTDVPHRDDRADALVELAHESVTDARSATLLIEGIGQVGSEAGGVTLAQRRGRPVLLCPARGSLVTVVDGGCAVVLAVPAPRDAATVVFFGRLQLAETYGTDAERTAVVELVPASIVIESDSGEREHVDLARYAEHAQRHCRAGHATLSDTEFTRVAEQMRIHTNAHHGGRLVDAVAELTATPAVHIAGAALSSVQRDGMILEWTDTGGGHRLSLSFTRPVAHPAALAAAIRDALGDDR